MSIATDAPESAAAATTSTWRKPLTIGLAANAALCLFLLGLIGEVIPPVLVFLILFAALAGATAYVKARWVQIVTVVVGVFFIAGNMPFIVEDLSHPDTWAGFVPIWLLVLDTLFVIAAAVMVFRSASSSARVPAIALGALAVVGVVVSVAMTMGVESDTRQAGDVLVVAEDVEYPTEVTVAADGAVFVENKDKFRHTFTVDDQGIDVGIPGGADKRVEIDLASGEYTFRCDVPGHEDMEGVLLVE